LSRRYPGRWSDEFAVGVDHLAVDPPPGRPGRERHDAGDVAAPAETAQPRQGGQLFLLVGNSMARLCSPLRTSAMKQFQLGHRWPPRWGSTSSWPAWGSRCPRPCCWPSSPACGGEMRPQMRLARRQGVHQARYQLAQPAPPGPARRRLRPSCRGGPGLGPGTGVPEGPADDGRTEPPAQDSGGRTARDLLPAHGGRVRRDQARSRGGPARGGGGHGVRRRRGGSLTDAAWGQRDRDLPRDKTRWNESWARRSAH
jgi:hypothetical protein